MYNSSIWYSLSLQMFTNNMPVLMLKENRCYKQPLGYTKFKGEETVFALQFLNFIGDCNNFGIIVA